MVLVCAAIPAPVTLKLSRLPEYLSPEEQAMQETLFARTDLTPAQLMYNIQVNGRWRRNHYYRPTPDTFARLARYEWTHDQGYYDTIALDMANWNLRGAFDAGKIPTLIVEAEWDLTWNADDKPAAVQQLHPQARLERFARSGHLPFNDEPDRFFPMLEAFLHGLNVKY